MSHGWVAGLIVVIRLLCPATAAEPPGEGKRPQGKLAPAPLVQLQPRPPLTIAKAVRIKALIARLADVDRPDLGYSPTFGGFAFLPVPGHIQEDSLTWTNHRLKSSQVLKELVAIGPDALPFLLDSLGDKTPTKLILKHIGSGTYFRDGATWFSDELSGNPLNPREVEVIDREKRGLKDGKHVEEYTIRVGDLCFVAIGQITGRAYMAARYQMTACTVLNSPVEKPAFRKRIRKIWSSSDPRRTLFESLWIDYRSTEMIRFQAGAVLRLLYYFPKESAPIIAARLNGLDLSKTVEGTEGFNRQRMTNGGIFVDEFVHAAAWCKEPAIREAVRDIFRRTADPQVFEASLLALDAREGELIVKRSREILDGLTGEELKRGGRSYVLGVMAARGGPAATSTFRRMIAKADPVELGSLAEGLKEAKNSWAVPLLIPLLDDTHPIDRVYLIRKEVANKPSPVLPLPPIPAPAPPVPVPGRRWDDDYNKVPVRVCDAAAETLAVLLPDERGHFPTREDRASLDRYLGNLKSKLAAK